MNLEKIRPKRHPKLMIIPMIDIIFFLLVFFMMSTLYMSEQKALPIALPQAASGEALPENIISVMVKADGKIFVDEREIDQHELTSCFAALWAESKEESLFVLRADEKAEYGSVVFVMDSLRMAGIKRVAFATAGKAD